MTGPHIVSSPIGLRAELVRWRRSGETIALVPTMGALHEGHLSLVRLARDRASKTVVSIFVNPTQFAPDEDFGAYPRTFESDAEKLGGAGADLIFRPASEDMYPPGSATTVLVGGPATAGLEDAFRPTHFAGVATIVTKLLALTGPDFAVFGEKDYQQLAVIRRLVRDLDIATEIMGGPIFREPDGLAMSSRNVYLTPVEREIAPTLRRELTRTGALLMSGGKIEEAMERGREAIVEAGFALDYFELRDAATLAPAGGPASERRLLVAARIGRTRLIDNLALAPGAGPETRDKIVSYLEVSKPFTLADFARMRAADEKIAVLTCYDASFAALLERAGVEILLVGNSLGNVVQGHVTTLPVSIDQMIYHTECVVRGRTRSFVMTDMPFGSYQESPAQAMRSAARLMAAGAQCVKLEGGAPMAPTVRFLVERGVPVCGHIGLTPQAVNQLGGYRVQGRSPEQAQILKRDALALQDAGASFIVLEMTPSALSAEVTSSLNRCATIGIGAGPDCSGQVLVLHDLLGVTSGKRPRFVRDFLAGSQSVEAAVKSYVASVKDGGFPAPEHGY